MGNNTTYDIGIRRNIKTLGERNFEPTGVQYASKLNGLWFNGLTYNIGVSLPYDVGGVSYSVGAVALLRFYWDQNFINPLT